jgi:seryl-tRNA synthetase
MSRCADWSYSLYKNVLPAQVSGSKFYYLKNEAVLLEMALVSWAIAEVSKKGFTPLITPEIVRSSVVERCGFQPRAQNTQVWSPMVNIVY